MSGPIQITVRLNRTAAALLLIAGMALGALLLSVAQSDEHGDGGTEVRVSARQLDDGRVEVSVQQRGADGVWGERQRPTARFVPADPPAGWLNSSSVTLAATRPWT